MDHNLEISYMSSMQSPMRPAYVLWPIAQSHDPYIICKGPLELLLSNQLFIFQQFVLVHLFCCVIW